jgi:5-hydroxyisourate hydrolase
VSGFLTTHVLDTARGRPARGVEIELARLEHGRRRTLRTATTNADGRTDAPLLAQGELEAGEYELVFAVGGYFGQREFLDRVPVRFSVSDPGAHYHVPLLVSPWSYSTYRGS